MKKFNSKRVMMMIYGIILVGISVGLFRMSSLGTDPFTTMNLGVSSFLNLSFGTYQLIVNLVLFMIVFFLMRDCISLGTIVNMVFIGYIADAIVHLFIEFGVVELAMHIRIMMAIIAVIITSLGVSLYMTADLGIAPYDALALLIVRVTEGKYAFAWARVTTDVLSVLIGFYFGGVLGVITLVTAFFTGPLVQFFRQRFAEPLLLSNGKLESTL